MWTINYMTGDNAVLPAKISNLMLIKLIVNAYFQISYPVCIQREWNYSRMHFHVGLYFIGFMTSRDFIKVSRSVAGRGLRVEKFFLTCFRVAVYIVYKIDNLKRACSKSARAFRTLDTEVPRDAFEPLDIPVSNFGVQIALLLLHADDSHSRCIASNNTSDFSRMLALWSR